MASAVWAMTGLREPLGGLLAAVGFLTRVPIRFQPSDGDVARSVVWFPFVGLLVGAGIGAVHATLAPLVGMLPSAALAVTAGILVTGGLHEDGLADTADGFGGGWTPEARLEIMDDSRQGTYGVLALCCSVVIRVTALGGLAGWEAVAAVAAVHGLSRSWAVACLMWARPAGPGGLAASIRRLTGPGLIPVALLSWAAVALALIGPVAFAVTTATGLAATAAALALAYRKIGGVTGDVLGAVEQLSQGLGLVAVAAVLSRWGIW